ncbi:GNAT family N-acetyltransferase [Dokdonella koreensis]|uniref:N-acetyltransferase GCN5 n=1 Tax=Dokdonella koreensis DS-123 TaxID=1300342 RepID=A0A167H6V6_9GAMM|nr:GNAT family N-acetyltransferase [Dokdonella koreensis]ANB19216.1 N-acetyltransferase GCN5 [Dokdonella koreensis DS-123]
MTPPVPRLETERLVLRPPLPEDFEDFAAFSADAEAMRHLGGVQPRPVAWRSFVGLVGSWHVRGYAFFSVIEKATGRWVGRLGPWMPEGWPGTEVGWSIARPFWGRGYAPEGAAAAIDWAFDTLGWTEVVHAIDAANTNSKAVATKLGSRYLRPGRLPAPLDLDVELWGQSREEWRARRAGGTPA